MIMRNLYEKQYPGHVSTFSVGSVQFGTDFVHIAGPCAVECEQELQKLAQQLEPDIFRGGVFKARTSPYSFTGLGEKGLTYLEQVGQQRQKPILVEFLTPEQIDLYSSRVDMIQIGARNMYNYPLLQKAAQSNKPVLLKRHFSATLDEFLNAAEYILAEGNDNVLLCERGIRTFETRYRNCLDLSGVTVLKQITHLPVLVDPSHAAGDSSIVVKLALAAVCAGADGLVIEVHPNPIESLSDAPQAITPIQFRFLRKKVEKLLGFLNL